MNAPRVSRSRTLYFVKKIMIPISDSISLKGFPLINVLLIAFTSFVFLQEITVPHPDAFIAKYSLIPSLINFSNYSTLAPFVTAIFIHGGFLHIASNMLFLWVFGNNVEKYFGAILFLFIYFISGVIGNLTQYALMPSSTIPMLGASGAIAGILGTYFMLFPKAKIKTIIPIFFFFPIIELPSTVMLGYWFFLQLFSGVSALQNPNAAGIAFFAHIGGFATGIILTILLRRYFKK